MVSRDVDCVSGYAYDKRPKIDLTSGYEIGNVPDHKALKVVHTGSYKHLGNAWSTAMGAQMALKKRKNKAIPMCEVYNNNPHEVEEKDRITSIYVPVR